ncbi:mechanosensitive ion channel protein, partial [Candidatus Endoriftia persephone str. Guaymas]|nr:mechanosensitive ion channel protein [Candidatus Endoriftia persephone str. Guaymas]
MESIEAKVLPLLAQFPDQPYLQSLLVVIVTLLLAKGISWILLGILKRLAGLTRAQFDDALVDALKTPLFYTILMTGFSIAVHLLPLSEPSQHLTIALLQTIGIFVWMRFAISLSRSGLQALAADPHRFNYIQAQTLPLFENLMVLLIIAIALYLIFISWGIDMSAWLAS